MSLSQLRAISCSIEEGKVRYPRKTEAKVPESAPWRNNLTALSQYYNLFFIAQVDKIHVFQPHFPSQKISRKLLLIIDLPVSQYARPGYIDNFKPHAVNHLIVGDLGNEEILLVACDDGDVIAYRTRSIADVSNQKNTETDELTLETGPILHENVSYSAWGLAIHKRARLIAVSSNSHVVHVFAFALYPGENSGDTTPSSGDSDTRDFECNRAHRTGLGGGIFFPMWTASDDPLHDREYVNIALPLSKHQNNIPNIAFYNPEHTADDANSTVYLASIDIDDQLVIWDVWNRIPSVSSRRHWSNSQARGWSVAFIEDSTTHKTQTTFDSFGLLSPLDLCSKSMNISSHIQNIPDNSSQHPAFAKFSIVPTAPTSVDASEEIEGISEADEEDYDAGESQGFDSDSDVQEVFQNTAAAHQSTDHGPHMLLAPDSGSANPDSSSEDEDHSERKPSKTSSTDAKPDAKTLYQAPTLPFNILITCEKDIKLLSNISQDAISNSCMCENAVSQTMPPGLPQLKHIERLNMVHQIPELGVVAIANQAGRVALLTMTFYQPQRQPSFKIEAILPYESQEKKDVRPEYQLVGMAISPVQGQQARAPYEELFAPFSPPLHKERGTRRWRLMMTYMDHTILSYEISRPRGDLEVLAI